MAALSLLPCHMSLFSLRLLRLFSALLATVIKAITISMPLGIFCFAAITLFRLRLFTISISLFRHYALLIFSPILFSFAILPPIAADFLLRRVPSIHTRLSSSSFLQLLLC